MPDPLDAATVDQAGSILAPGGLVRGAWAVSGLRLLLSYDSGSAWIALHMPALPAAKGMAVGDHILYDVASVDPLHAWVARSDVPASDSDRGVTLFVDGTADGGATWHRATFAGDFGFGVTMLFVDARQGLLVVFDGQATVYRTTDGGVTWARGPRVPTGGDFVIQDANTLLASSSGGEAMCTGSGQPTLTVSRDGGKSWAPVRLAGYPSKTTCGFGIVAVAFLDGSNGFLAIGVQIPPNKTVFFSTRDGGRSWTRTATVPHWFTRIRIVDRKDWFAVSPEDELMVSRDAGKTWTSANAKFPEGWGWDVWFTDGRHGVTTATSWAAGNYTTVVYVTSDTGATWVPATFPPA